MDRWTEKGGGTEGQRDGGREDEVIDRVPANLRIQEMDRLWLKKNHETLLSIGTEPFRKCRGNP